MSVINISVPFSFGGNVFKGISVMPGVGFDLVDAPCGSERKLMSFSNTLGDVPTGIFFDAVSSVDVSEYIARDYFIIDAQEEV